MGAIVKETKVSRVLRIPLAVWNKYNLADGDFVADWYDSMDRDAEREVDGRRAIVIHFKEKNSD